jgi:lysophospholipase L1-like esterase
MTAPGRLLSRLLAVVIAVAGLVAVGATPATAGHSRTLQYVALGDSYAAGQGAGNYLNRCLQSTDGYPALLDSRKHVHLRANASCTGATTFDVVNTQVSALDKWTTLVTLTVGANDLHVAAVAAACTKEPTSTECTNAIANALSQLAGLGRRLPNVYTAIAAAAPRAEILVTGYPYLFETPTQCTPEVIICQINSATAALNQTIEDTVAAMPDSVDIEYVDVTARFAGHGIGSPDPFINAAGPDAFHPNDAGYEAYAAAISAYLP